MLAPMSWKRTHVDPMLDLRHTICNQRRQETSRDSMIRHQASGARPRCQPLLRVKQDILALTAFSASAENKNDGERDLPARYAKRKQTETAWNGTQYKVYTSSGRYSAASMVASRPTVVGKDLNVLRVVL
jgi:hypothetical protein